IIPVVWNRQNCGISSSTNTTDRRHRRPMQTELQNIPPAHRRPRHHPRAPVPSRRWLAQLYSNRRLQSSETISLMVRIGGTSLKRPNLPLPLPVATTACIDFKNERKLKSNCKHKKITKLNKVSTYIERETEKGN